MDRGSHRLRIAIAIVATTWSGLSFAESGPCPGCSQFEQFRPLVKLSQQVAAIGIRAVQDSAAPFWQSSEGRLAYMLQLDADSRIPERCKKEFKSRPTLDVLARGAWDTSRPQVSVDGASHYQLNSDYRAVSESRRKLESLNPTNRDAISNLKGIMSSKDWSEVLEKARGMRGLSAAQRVSLLTLFSARAKDYYDHAQAADTTGKADPNPSEIFDVMKSNEANGYYSNLDTYKGKGPGVRSSGVCRHHALAGAQLAEALGFKNSVVVTYSHTSNAGHATFAFSDGKTTHLMNYGIHATTTGVDGGQALAQRGGDTALQYQLYRASDGKQIAAEASETGKFLAKVAGFRPLNPGAQSYSSLVAPTFQYGPQGIAESRAFFGNDGNGASYLGATQSLQAPASKYFDAKASVTGYNQFRPQSVYNPNAAFPSSALNHLTGVYGQVELGLRTPSVKIPLGDLQARIEATATGIMNMAYAHGGDSPASAKFEGAIQDTAVYGSTGIRVVQGGNDPLKSRFMANYYAGMTVVGGGSDVRKDGTYGGPMIPVINDLVFSAEARGRLCSNADVSKPGCAYLFAHALVLADYFGVRGQGDAGIAIDNFAASLGVRGRLTEDMPNYREGSVRSLTATVKKRIPLGTSTTLDLTAEGQQKVEPDDHGRQVGVGARLTY